MGRNGLLIGEVASRSGVSRKALRLYEQAGILAAPRRTTAGYRVYGPETLATLAFVAQARRLGFHLDEIKEVVQIRGRAAVRVPTSSTSCARRFRSLTEHWLTSPKSVAGFKRY